MKKSLDRLLRETLRGRTASPGPCLDADSVAAWFDDTLDAAGRDAAEAHAADCARCQALLAAMIRTAPPAAHAASRRRFMGWIAPLGVTAAGVLVWVSLSGRAVPPQIPSETPAPAEATPGAAVEQDARAGGSASPESTVPAAARPDRPAASDAVQRNAAKREAQSDNAAPRDASVETLSAGAQPAAAEPAPPVEEPAAGRSEAAATPSAAPVTGRLPVPQAGTAPPASARALSARLVDPPRESVIASADAATLWRIAAAGTVQRSTDGGATWESQATGVTVTLTAGASPSPSVCWLVGPGGVVLISTDGRTWQRLAFPEAVDLVSIRAADDTTATVTAADGRRFATATRGRVWEPVPDR